jgi:hypothetical protein
MGSRKWIKVYCDKWLSGTLREDTPDMRGVWIDLLVLAGSGQYGDTGEIKLRNGVGFTNRQIAEILHISMSLWRQAKSRFIETDRIEITPRGAISITNWRKYQSEFERQKPYRERKVESFTPEPKIPFNNTPIDTEIEKESEKLQREVTTRSYNRIDTITDDLSLSHLTPKGSKEAGFLPSYVLENETKVGKTGEKYTYNLEGKAEANSLTNGNTVLPGEDRATLESDLSALSSPSRGTYRQRILAYLKANGPASIKTIAQATAIKANAVNVTLYNGKDKVFVHYADERTWGLACFGITGNIQ